MRSVYQVDGFAGIVSPFANKFAVHLAECVVVEVVDDVHLIDLGALRGLELRVDCAKRGAAHARTRCGLFDEQRFRAIFCGACGGKVSRRAGADDDDFEVERLNTVAIGDLGCLAKPIVGFVTIGGGSFFGTALLRRAAARHACDGGEAHGCRCARQKRATIHFCSHCFPFPCAPGGASFPPRARADMREGSVLDFGMLCLCGRAAFQAVAACSAMRGKTSPKCSVWRKIKLFSPRIGEVLNWDFRHHR